MPELDNNGAPATVPEQPESKPPLRKGMPVILALVVIVALIGIANLSSLLKGNKKSVPASALTMSPTTSNAQQVASFETQQKMQARHDAEEQQRQQALAQAFQRLQEEQAVPSPESNTTPPMTAAQRDSIYGGSSNAPQRTSNVSETQAEAKQKRLAHEKQERDALNSDTVAIDFSHGGSNPVVVLSEQQPTVTTTNAEETLPRPASVDPMAVQPVKSDTSEPMGSYSFDQYQGRLYRVFEGTVLEGVVTNHIDGGFSGPILVMLTTDYYSHDHLQLLMPQGTRLIGSVQSVGNTQQRKMFVTFHRAVCPDGFSLDFDKYVGLDPIGTTGVATKIDHGYLLAFGAAAAIGGLGGLAQIGNSGTVLDPSAQVRNGISAQTAAEGQQVLNHFLNRLPVITFKEGSRARVYIGRDILIPSYAEHRVDPTL
ncbi:TrbI/VirB10 family protein [Terriglobus sp. TAA 43]|uniref:TrbI/VirB10 family protein n=1 Tax=Terriglobus sp. TAA 43 TaxID=278961 RepID=UPI0006463031|nr:TrbI/VirB10 family protein [Terriglobus sp. TAA 43]